MDIYTGNVEKFKKALDEGKELYKEEMDAEGGSRIEVSDEIGEIVVGDDEITVNFSNDLGYFTVAFLVNEVMEDVMRIAIKKMNKIKTMLESLK